MSSSSAAPPGMKHGMLRGNSYVYYENGAMCTATVPELKPGDITSRFRRAVALQQHCAWREAFREFNSYINSSSTGFV